MIEISLKSGEKLRLSCLKSNPEVIIESINESDDINDIYVFYTLNDKEYKSPITAIHCNVEGWYTLEIENVKN